MLRECMEREALAKILLESDRFFRMFDFIVLDSFDISSDAHRTFRVSHYANYLSSPFFHFGFIFLSFLWVPFYLPRKGGQFPFGFEKKSISRVLKRTSAEEF